MNGTTDTSTAPLIVQAMTYIGANADLLQGAYSVRANSNEVIVQGYREDVEHLIDDLGMTKAPEDLDFTDDRGSRYTHYIAPAREPYAPGLYVELVVTDRAAAPEAATA